MKIIIGKQFQKVLSAAMALVLFLGSGMFGGTRAMAANVEPSMVEIPAAYKRTDRTNWTSYEGICNFSATNVIEHGVQYDADGKGSTYVVALGSTDLTFKSHNGDIIEHFPFLLLENYEKREIHKDDTVNFTKGMHEIGFMSSQGHIDKGYSDDPKVLMYIYVIDDTTPKNVTEEIMYANVSISGVYQVFNEHSHQYVIASAPVSFEMTGIDSAVGNYLLSIVQDSGIHPDDENYVLNSVLNVGGKPEDVIGAKTSIDEPGTYRVSSSGSMSLVNAGFVSGGDGNMTLILLKKELSSGSPVSTPAATPTPPPVTQSTQPPTVSENTQTAMSTASENTQTATPIASTVMVNGENIAFDAYNIGGNNYFKLRDLAYILSGTVKQFEVDWDGENNAISLISGKPYTVTSSEMLGKSAGNKTAMPTTSKIYLDDKEVQFTAYSIEGNNYFKLRDIGKAFNFSVEWDGTNNTIVIDTDKAYVEP